MSERDGDIWDGFARRLGEFDDQLPDPPGRSWPTTRPTAATRPSGAQRSMSVAGLLGIAIVVALGALLAIGRPSTPDPRVAAPVTGSPSAPAVSITMTAGPLTSSRPSSALTPSAEVASVVTETVARFSFERPASWTAWQPNRSNPENGGPMLYLSTDPLLPTCATAPEASPNPPDDQGMACPWPLSDLSPDGVLVTWINRRILQPLPSVGELIRMNGADARLQRERPGLCERIGATETIAVLVPIGQPTPLSNFMVLACLRGPDTATSEAQLRAMLASVTFPGSPAEPSPSTDVPMETVPPGITFPPVEGKFTRGSAAIFANKQLYEKTGRLCIRRNFDESGGDADMGALEALAAGHPGREGLLAEGRSYLGDLEGAFLAFQLAHVGMELPDAAYGLGQVPAASAQPQLPEGTWWLPELIPFSLKDGRNGWTQTGQYFASPADCSSPSSPASSPVPIVEVDDARQAIMWRLKEATGHRSCASSWSGTIPLPSDAEFAAIDAQAAESSDGFWYDPVRNGGTMWVGEREEAPAAFGATFAAQDEKGFFWLQVGSGATLQGIGLLRIETPAGNAIWVNHAGERAIACSGIGPTAVALSTAPPSPPVSPDKLLSYPPLPTPLSSGNLAQYINAALFARTGRTCMSISDEFVPEPSIEEMAQEAEGKTGLLPGGTTFVGGFDGASAAFGGESSGIELDGHAYTIGRANGSRWAPKLPPDTWIMYEFKRYDLPDGREVWRYQYSWWASPEDCGDGS